MRRPARSEGTSPPPLPPQEGWAAVRRWGPTSQLTHRPIRTGARAGDGRGPAGEGHRVGRALAHPPDGQLPHPGSGPPDGHLARVGDPGRPTTR
jgi:hypothetical protein